jgi:hypothetical protein
MSGRVRPGGGSCLGLLAIRDHRARNKHLRLFEGTGDGTVTYLGEYEYDSHHHATIPGSGNSGPRQGIVFTRAAGTRQGTRLEPPSPTRLL